MSKKTERTNKTNLVVNWPTTDYFTIEDLWALNPEFINITLRVRLTKELEKGVVAEIGCKTGGQGRPKKVFALTPIRRSVLDLARTNNITLIDESKLQGLLGVTTPSVTNIVTPTPVTV